MPQILSKVDTSELEKMLVPVGFYKTKAKHIKETSMILLEEYDGDIPNTVELLKKLPGVGPKVGCLIETVAMKLIRFTSRWLSFA